MNETAKYSEGLPKELAGICKLLQKEIEAALKTATSRIYYSMPVWFIADNPVVGYKASSRHVILLFWGGQSFADNGLKAAGKFKAAEIKYSKVREIELPALRKWLKQSKKFIWDYNNLRKTGSLKLLGE
jgi:hypothetical protein